MKICIAGKNRIAVHGLKAAIGLVGCESVSVCLNRSDDGNSNWQPSLRRYAVEFGIRAVSLEDCYKVKDLIFISLEFDRIIVPSRFRSKKLFNIHFSKLPAYKGMYTSAWPILNGEIESAVTLHLIDHGIDTGDIIDQSTFALDGEETARSLYLKYLEQASSLIEGWIGKIVVDEIVGVPQAIDASSYYGKSSIDYSNLNIQVKQTANVISRQIRAYSFREFQTPEISSFPIGSFDFTGDRSTKAPGAIRKKDDDSMVISTIDYDLRLGRSYYKDFFAAIARRDVGEVEQLIEKGFEITQTNQHGWSGLMMACYAGDEAMCRHLLAHGADPNQANENGTTCLMYAKDACERTKNFNLCEYIIAAGADPNRRDAFSRTVLDYAIREEQSNAIAFFKALR